MIKVKLTLAGTQTLHIIFSKSYWMAD